MRTSGTHAAEIDKAARQAYRNEETEMANDWLISALSLGLAVVLTRIVASEMKKRRDQKVLDDGVMTWEGEGGQVPGATPASSIPGTTVKSGPMPHSPTLQ
jgi:hypothetical protein